MALTKNRVDDILLVGCLSDIDLGAVTVLTLETNNEFELDNSMTKVVIDLGSLYEVTPSAIRNLSLFALDIRKKGKLFYLLHPTRSFAKTIMSKGLDRLFNPIDDLSEIRNEAKKRKTIDVNFLNPFVEATTNTLKIQCSFDSVAGKPEIKAADFSHPVDIAGVIGITSEGFTGSISICFTEKIFLKVMSNMLGEECNEINQEMEDGAGELLNIIFGQAKIVLNQLGYSLEKAIPTIVRGKQLKVKHITSYATFILPFRTDLGTFYMEIGAEV
jgi:chemotaxis protein CheX